MMRASTLMLALLLVAPRVELLSEDWPVREGAKVRVWATDPPSSPLVGRVAAVNSDTLLLETEWRTIAIPLDALSALEISTRRGFDARSGLGGAGVGVLAGAALVFLSGDEASRN